MSQEQTWQSFQTVVNRVAGELINFPTVVVFLAAIIGAYIVGKLLTRFILAFVHFLGNVSGIEKNEDRRLQLRRIDTYLSIGIALTKFLVFAIAIIAAWEFTHPNSAPVAIIASGTIFIVMAGATIVPLLRDLTAGSIMIAEKWFNVGDYITVEPFTFSGVVERMNLRSTKIRSLSGETVWIHNQNIQGVRVTPRGVRTLAIDIFVSNLEKGKKVIEDVAKTLPVEPAMLADPLQIVETAKLGDKLWQITAMSDVTPGREWLLENFAKEAIEEKDKKNGKVVSYGPIVYNADPVAQRRFRRAIRIKKAPAAKTAEKPHEKKT